MFVLTSVILTGSEATLEVEDGYQLISVAVLWFQNIAARRYDLDKKEPGDLFPVFLFIYEFRRAI